MLLVASLAWAHPVSLPPPVADGEAFVTEGPARVFVGHGSLPGPSAPDLRVWLSGATRQPAPPEWFAAPFFAAPDATEQSTKRALRRFSAAASAHGPGDAAVPWRHVNLVVAGRTLRLVIAPAGGPWFADVESWLPKVLGDDPTVLLVSDVRQLPRLRELASRHSASLLLTAWPGDPGLILPNGAFGELSMQIGDGATLIWSGEALTIEGMDRPIRASWSWSGGWTVGLPTTPVPTSDPAG